jgi:hypothetical protein
MQKELFEKYYRVLGILLLVLAPINGGAAYALCPEHPIMALANGAMAAAIVLAVILFWHPGRRG